jgi:hypothetical protein
MRERTKDGSHDQQDENYDGDQVPEDDGWPATASQRSIGDPDCEERIHRRESITQSWIFVLS